MSRLFPSQYCSRCSGRGYIVTDRMKGPGDYATEPCTCTRSGGQRELDKEANDRFYGWNGERPFGGW